MLTARAGQWVMPLGPSQHVYPRQCLEPLHEVAESRFGDGANIANGSGIIRVEDGSPCSVKVAQNLRALKAETSGQAP
jgi:hypothetical protein